MTNARHCCTYLAFLVLVALSATLQDALAEKDVTLTKLGQNVGTATLRFSYCYSCGYRRMFDDYVEIIYNKYPGIIIDGRNYDPPGLNMFLSRVIGIVKMLAIMCILGGINVFTYIGQPQPSWWTWCVENKLYACMMLFFLCNIIEGQLISSGAFEISLNDVPIWSKLETGRIPQPNELFQIIESQMRMSQGNRIERTPDFAK